MIHRRSLITGLASLIAAPAVIRQAGLLMPISAPRAALTPYFEADLIHCSPAAMRRFAQWSMITVYNDGPLDLDVFMGRMTAYAEKLVATAKANGQAIVIRSSAEPRGELL